MDPAAAVGRFLHFRPQHGLLLHVGGVLETVHDTTDQNPSRELENTELLNTSSGKPFAEGVTTLHFCNCVGSQSPFVFPSSPRPVQCSGFL